LAVPTVKRPKRNGANPPSGPSTSTRAWEPNVVDWEPLIEKIDTVERNHETDKLYAFIDFKNGRKTKVGMEKVYKHCPRAMLKFYEEHL
jgi:chromobox protein 1